MTPRTLKDYRPQHDGDCQLKTSYTDRRCTCGLDDLLGDRVGRDAFLAGFAAGVAAIDKFGEQHETGEDAYVRFSSDLQGVEIVRQEQEKTLGGHVPHGGREDLEPL